MIEGLLVQPGGGNNSLVNKNCGTKRDEVKQYYNNFVLHAVQFCFGDSEKELLRL